MPLLHRSARQPLASACRAGCRAGREPHARAPCLGTFLGISRATPSWVQLHLPLRKPGLRRGQEVSLLPLYAEPSAGHLAHSALVSCTLFAVPGSLQWGTLRASLAVETHPSSGLQQSPSLPLPTVPRLLCRRPLALCPSVALSTPSLEQKLYPQATDNINLHHMSGEDVGRVVPP